MCWGGGTQVCGQAAGGRGGAPGGHGVSGTCLTQEGKGGPARAPFVSSALTVLRLPSEEQAYLMALEFHLIFSSLGAPLFAPVPTASFGVRSQAAPGLEPSRSSSLASTQVSVVNAEETSRYAGIICCELCPPPRAPDIHPPPRPRLFVELLPRARVCFRPLRHIREPTKEGSLP